MARKWLYALIGSLVTSGVLGGVAAGSHRYGPRAALADAPRHHGFGHWHGGHGDGWSHLCAQPDAALDGITAYLKRALAPTEAQAEAFARLARSLGDAASLMARACDGGGSASADETAAAALERMETLMAAGLEALRGVRPAFDALYAVLDERQRATLDALFAHEARS